MNPLHPDHLADLRKSGLSDEIIGAAGIKSVPPREIPRKLNGASDKDVESAYEIPYSQHGYSRLRVFGPKIDHRNKYKQPKGQQVCLYVHEPTRPKLNDPAVPLYVAEGEKKALAAIQAGLCAVAIGGLVSWGRKGKLLPDFDAIPMENREVIIIPDNDWKSKEFGKRYAKWKTTGVEQVGRFTRALMERGAKVKVLLLPASHEKIGLDDFLVQRGAGALGELECIAGDDFKKKEEPAPEKSKVSQAKILVELAVNAELFHDSDGECFATIPMDGHLENWPIRSKSFKRWLSRLFYERMDTPPGSQALSDAMNVIEGGAQFEGKEEKTFVRLAGVNGSIYLDLADDAWKCVEITGSGWQVLRHSPVKFLRPKGLLPLPVPKKGGSLDDLRPFLNCADDAVFKLIIGWLVQAINPVGPYPILIFEGEQGSAKSTCTRALRNTVDPNLAPIRSIPRDEKDLIIAAINGLVVAYDNLSGLPTFISDALCRLATGGGIGTRELYTNGSEFIFEATRPVILNGIDQIASRHDLADRSIIVTLPSILEDKRKLERLFWAEFEREHPRILGALLDAVSTAIAKAKSTKLESLPRMADFATWVTAAETRLPWERGGFLKAYETNRFTAIRECLAADPVACALEAMMILLSEWSGTHTALLEELKTHVPDETAKSKHWPKDATRLSKRIRRNATFLRQVGIHIEASKSGERTIRIRKGT